MFIRYLLLFFFFFLSTSLIAKTPIQKPVLKVVASVNTGYTNEDNTGLYWKIIEEVFQGQYKIEKVTTKWDRAIELVSSGKADILLGTTNQDDNRLLYSSSHINKTYPIHAFYLKDRFTINSFTEFDNLSIALRQGSSIDRLLKNKDNIYEVNSIYQADRLVLNQRVDIALAYSYNTHLVSPKNLLSNQEVISERNVYLAFSNNQKGKIIQSSFEKAMQNAINENRLIGLFSNELDYQHAIYPKNNVTNVIQWNLAPKLYNKKTKRLEVLKREVDYSQYLIEQMPKYNFKINTKTSKLNQKVENINLTTCSFNIKRNEKQLNNLYFSKPAHVFIKPKLFFLKSSSLNDLLTSNGDSHTININELITNSPYLQISIRENSSIHKSLTSLLNASVLNKLHVVDELNYKNMMSLLLANRINGFIAWPTIVSELLDNKEDIKNIRSTPIEENIGKNMFSYITCTKSDDGKEVIGAINEILSNPNHHQALFQQTLKQLDQDSQNEYIKLMQLEL